MILKQKLGVSMGLKNYYIKNNLLKIFITFFELLCYNCLIVSEDMVC